jgi:hypothetical protein
MLRKSVATALTRLPSREHLAAWSRHGALNAGQAAGHIGAAIKGPGRYAALKEVLENSVYAAMPPTHHAPGELAYMVVNRQGRHLTHRDWYRRGRFEHAPDPEALIAALEAAP